MNNPRSIVVSSSFAAKPLEEPLLFWLKRLGHVARLVFTPELQVMQQLLDSGSPINTNEAGLNVLLLRWQDLDGSGQGCERTFNDFCDALRTALRTEIPLLIITCPSTPESAAADRADRYTEWDKRLVVEAGRYPGKGVIPSMEWQDLYPVASPYEPGGDKLALLPYSSATFAVLATVIARRFHMLASSPYKLIAVDCDDTLWSGACGEDGPLGVGLDAANLTLQRFLLSQMQQGCLLCLCSKNNPEDVEAVFRERPEMPLRREHFTAVKINWKAKPENLLDLATELGLGTDGFIFIDDNPLECEIMRRSLPEVLTLQLPADKQVFGRFLKRVWAFDRPAVSDEDRKRLSFYTQETERVTLQQRSASLQEFIESLELKLEFRSLTPENVGRASQLTFRVNQFNLTTIRRTEAELLRLVDTRSLCGWMVGAGDRFGTYGLVGLVLFATTAECLRIDTFLLSCRALGRGVEHRVTVELAEHARSAGVEWIQFSFLPSGKNQPAGEFLESEFGDCRRPSEVGAEYRIPVERALSARFTGERKQLAHPFASSGKLISTEKSEEGRPGTVILAWAAHDLCTGDTIQKAIEDWRRKERPSRECVQPSTGLESRIAEIWKEILGVTNVGIRDNFFELGGDSLAMVRVILRVHELSGYELPMRAFFETPTIEEQLQNYPIADQNGGC